MTESRDTTGLAMLAQARPSLLVSLIALVAAPLLLLGPSGLPPAERIACDPLNGPFMNARFISPGDVSLSTGAFTMDDIDLRATGGAAGTFRRSYVSLDTRTASLGPGWTSSVDVRLRADGGSGHVLWTQTDGATERFLDAWDVPTAFGTSRGYRTLVHRDDGSWIVRDLDDTWTFDYDGQLVRYEDVSGDWMEFLYEEGKPASTVGPDGPGLTFEFAAGDRLARVASASDPSSAVEYEYDPIGRLVRVAAGAGSPLRFVYLDASQQITKITDDSGKTLFTIDYDEAGWVVREQDFIGSLDGEARTYSYEHGSGWDVRATVVSPPSLADPSWHPVKIATMDAESRLIELQVQPTRRQVFIGRYNYDDVNRRIPLDRPCSEVIAEQAPST
jgi:hypothetical protein